MIIPAGTTSVITYWNMKLLVGGPATGLTATDFDITYTRTQEAAVKADIDAVLSTAATAFNDDSGIEVDATNAPGLWRFDFPDLAFAASGTSPFHVILSVKHASCVTPHHLVELGNVPADVQEVGGTTQTAGDLAALITTADTAIDVAVADLANGTDGLSALKALIDAVPTTAMRGTYFIPVRTSFRLRWRSGPCRSSFRWGSGYTR